MIRDFCICCGAPVNRVTGLRSCKCSTEDLERREQLHLAEYGRANYLQASHFDRFVQDNARRVRVWDLVAELHPADTIREFPFKVTDDGLVFLFYSRNRGTRLLKWPWARCDS